MIMTEVSRDGWQDGSVCKGVAPKSDVLSSVPGTCIVKGEN